MFALYLKDMLQLVLSPTHGWEDISYDRPEPRKLLLSGFIPWIILTAVTYLLQGIYDSTITPLNLVLGVIVTFVRYFITYFLAVFLFSLFMPRLSGFRTVEKHSQIFIMFSLGLLALMTLVKNCMPIDLAILNFFPLYIILIMWRGARYMKVTPPALTPFVALNVFTIIVPPMVLYMFFNLIIP